MNDLLTALAMIGGTAALSSGGWFWWARSRTRARRDVLAVLAERERTERLRLEQQVRMQEQESADRIYFDLTGDDPPPAR